MDTFPSVTSAKNDIRSGFRVVRTSPYPTRANSLTPSVDFAIMLLASGTEAAGPRAENRERGQMETRWIEPAGHAPSSALLEPASARGMVEAAARRLWTPRARGSVSPRPEWSSPGSRTTSWTSWCWSNWYGVKPTRPGYSPAYTSPDEPEGSASRPEGQIAGSVS